MCCYFFFQESLLYILFFLVNDLKHHFVILFCSPNFANNEFDNVQGIGLLYATIDQNIVVEEYKIGQTQRCSFSQLDNVMRFTFTIDDFKY